jgi:DNA-directed RNA polymerase subunit F
MAAQLRKTSPISDEDIREDICRTLRMWEQFNKMDKEKQESLVEYLFESYAHLYRTDNIRLDTIQ